MKFNLGITQSSIDISFDYPNLVLDTYIPFIWNLNTKKYNNEGRLWNYSQSDNFYLKLVSIYTHKEYYWNGDILTTNNRYTEARFQTLGFDDIEWQDNQDQWENETLNWEFTDDIGVASEETDGFFYCYFIIEPSVGDPLCIYENLAYIQIEGKRTTFTPMITNNEDREIIFA